MKKFKERKEILESPEFPPLALELLQENGYIDDNTSVENIDLFIERKIKQCKMQGV